MIPSMDNTVARRSGRACRECAMQSPPDFVERANWNGDVACSTALDNCCEIVLAMRRRTMSPTMPEHSQWACTTRSCGPTSPHPRSHRGLLPWQDLGRLARNGQCQLRCPRVENGLLSSAPRRTVTEVLREGVMIWSESGPRLMKKSLGSCSRGTGGRLFGSSSSLRVAFVPGANEAPSRACLPDDNSPSWTRASALSARRWMSSPPALLRRLRTETVFCAKRGKTRPCNVLRKRHTHYLKQTFCP